MKRRYRVLITLAAVALASAMVVAAFYGVENWRGAQAWENARRELALQGESLDPGDFIPPPIPDDRNLALIPAFAHALEYRVDPGTGRLTFGPHKPADYWFDSMPYGPGGIKPPGKVATWTSGHSLPLDRLQRYYAERSDFPHPPEPGAASADVLVALGRFAPLLDEIATAVQPEARFPVDWKHQPPIVIRLPHYILFQKMASVLRLRAVAFLAAGRHEDAARDLALAFRLREMILREPVFIRHLITVTCDNLMLQAVWEGLAARRWTKEVLHGIQEILHRNDLLSDYVQVIRGERAIMFCPTMDQLKKSGDYRQFIDVTNFDDTRPPAWVGWVMAFYPRGWIDQNEASVCLAYQRLITGAVDAKTHRVLPERVKATADERAAKGTVSSPQTLMVKIALPVCESVLAKTARAQVARDQAEIACALERYFLERQDYPENLDALVPAFLDRVPIDLIDGLPMRYQRTTDGRYRLWSVGWNGRDDGGVVAWPQTSSDDVRPDDKQGDWVWQYQPAEPPAGKR